MLAEPLRSRIHRTLLAFNSFMLGAGVAVLTAVGAVLIACRCYGGLP
jgi:hypothetical protein